MIRFTTLTVKEVSQLHSNLVYFNQTYSQLHQERHQQHLQHTDQESQERVT